MAQALRIEILLEEVMALAGKDLVSKLELKGKANATIALNASMEQVDFKSDIDLLKTDLNVPQLMHKQAGTPGKLVVDAHYTIPDELPEDGFLYATGVLAMANAGPDSTGSQFFIMLADAGLNNDFSYFGNVTDGFDTLEKIAAIPLGPNPFGEISVPLETLYINSVTIDQ